MHTPSISYKRHRFAAQIIAHAVWLYVRFNLSLREVEVMLLERGIDVSYETIRRWTINLVSRSPGTCDIGRSVPVTSDIWTKSS